MDFPVKGPHNGLKENPTRRKEEGTPLKRAWEITTAAKEAAVPHLKPKAVRGPAFAEQPTPEQAIRKQISDPVAD